MFVICDDRCNAAPLLLKNFGVRMCHIFLRFFRPSLGCKQLWESMHKISFIVMHNCSRKKTRKLKIIFVEYLYRRMWRCVLLKFYMFRLFFCFNGVGKYWLAWVRFRFLCVSKSISRHQSRHFSFWEAFSSTWFSPSLRTWARVFRLGNLRGDHDTSSEVDVAKRGGDQELEGDFTAWDSVHPALEFFKKVKFANDCHWELRKKTWEHRHSCKMFLVFHWPFLYSKWVCQLPPSPTGNHIQICFNAYLDRIRAYINATILQVIKGVSDICMCTNHRLLWPQISGICLSSGKRIGDVCGIGWRWKWPGPGRRWMGI